MSDNAKKIFADNLKRYIDSKGLTQLDLAGAMGCSSSTVSDWCNGRKYPRVDKMQRIADYLGVRMSDLTRAHDPLEDADIAFYSDSAHSMLHVHPGQIAIFLLIRIRVITLHKDIISRLFIPGLRQHRKPLSLITAG